MKLSYKYITYDGPPLGEPGEWRLTMPSEQLVLDECIRDLMFDLHQTKGRARRRPNAVELQGNSRRRNFIAWYNQPFNRVPDTSPEAVWRWLRTNRDLVLSILDTQES